MNIKIKSFLLTILIISIFQRTYANPLNTISFNVPTVTNISLFENLPRLICDYPFISTFIAAIISIVGYKKFFNNPNTTSSKPANEDNQTKYCKNIVITKNDAILFTDLDKL